MRSKWFERNNFDDNRGYLEKYLDYFEITRYHYTSDGYGHTALTIEINLNVYRLEVNHDDDEIIVYKKTTRRMGQRHHKEYMLKLDKTFKVDAIANSIKYVKQDSVKL